MKVVHLTPALFGADGIVGGGERYAFELARHMATRVATTLVTFGDPARRETVGPLDVRVLGGAWYVRGNRTNPVHVAALRGVGATPTSCTAISSTCSRRAPLPCGAGRERRRVFVSDLGGGGLDVSRFVSTDGWFHGHLHLSDYSRRIYRHETVADRARDQRRRGRREVLAGRVGGPRRRRVVRRASPAAQGHRSPDPRAAGRHAAHDRRATSRSRDGGGACAAGSGQTRRRSRKAR